VLFANIKFFKDTNLSESDWDEVLQFLTYESVDEGKDVFKWGKCSSLLDTR
jgi:hypothetical protein